MKKFLVDVLLPCTLMVIIAVVALLTIGEGNLPEKLEKALEANALFEAQNAELRDRIEFLEEAALDNNGLLLELKDCHANRYTDLNTLEDCRFMLKETVDSCPGRARPPRAPRP